MSKQVEVPKEVERFVPVIRTEPIPEGVDYATISPHAEGDLIRVADLSVIYKHFSDRLLSDEAVEAAYKQHWPRWIAMKPEQKDAARKLARADLRAALQAISTPEVDRA